MKNLLFIFLILSALKAPAQSILTAGDMAFVGVNTSAANAYSLITYKELGAGSTIYVTNCGWMAANSNTSAGYFRAGEHCVALTATAKVTKGSIISVDLGIYPGTTTISNGSGSISNTMAYSAELSNFIGLNEGADQLIVFMGTPAMPTLITAINIGGTWAMDATSAATSALPKGLTTGLTALNNTDNTPNARYNCNTDTLGTQAQLNGFINNFGHWTSRAAAYAFPDCANTALPVTLIGFYASQNAKRTASLRWEVANSYNNDYYAISRSLDANNFSEIAVVRAALESTQYTYTDDLPITQTTYYRLSQTDIDGTTTILSTKAINAQNADNIRIIAINKAEATIYSPQPSAATIHIIDLKGKLICTQSAYFNSGNNILTISNLPSEGVYIFRLISAEVILNKKMVY